MYHHRHLTPTRTVDPDQLTIDYLMARISERYPIKTEAISILRIMNNTRLQTCQRMFDEKYFRLFRSQINELATAEGNNVCMYSHYYFMFNDSVLIEVFTFFDRISVSMILWCM
jgi:hypothetical protein